jgi:hypothetical protein
VSPGNIAKDKTTCPSFSEHPEFSPLNQDFAFTLQIIVSIGTLIVSSRWNGDIAMAKRQKVNKTQAVRDYLKAHPKAMSGEIAAALTKQGIKIKPSHVANIKTQINKQRRAKKVAKTQAAVEAAAPAVVEQAAKASPTVTLEHVKAVALMVNGLGGSTRLFDLLALIKDVGGLKKFKDLLEAISGSEPDAIPF